MPYLGNTPASRFTSMDKQTITGDGGTDYTLDHAVGSEQEIEVFVNNVRQEPSVAYTVSGTDLTMTGNVASTDDFYVVFQGKAQQSVTHPTNSALQATSGTFSGALSATTGTFSGATSSTDLTLSGGLYVGGTGSANYLDDYEEGTWTPVLVGGTTTTYTSQIGRYTKIGQLVHVYFDLHINAVGNGSTNTVGGLPFATVNNDALAVSYWSGLIVSPYFISFQMGGSGALSVGTTSGTPNITNGIGIFGNSSRIIASGSYRTSAQEIVMALTEEILEDKIEAAGEFKHVHVRTVTIIKRDGVEISRSFHRHTVAPDADITGESAEVQAICAAVHTQAVKDAYAAHLAAQDI